MKKLLPPQAGEHWVAYRAWKDHLLIWRYELIAHNEQMVVKVIPVDKAYSCIEVIIPTHSFISNDSLRDKRIAEILYEAADKAIIYRSINMAVGEWQQLMSNRGGLIKGHMFLRAKKFAVEAQIRVEFDGNKLSDIGGAIYTNFHHLGIKPPRFIWGLVDQALDVMELHFNFCPKRIENFQHLGDLLKILVID